MIRHDLDEAFWQLGGTQSDQPGVAGQGLTLRETADRIAEVTSEIEQAQKRMARPMIVRRVVSFQPLVLGQTLSVLAACDDGTWWTCAVPSPMDIEPPAWRLTKIPPIQDAKVTP